MLDDLCLEILGKLSEENEKVIGDAKGIYLNISKKLMLNEPLSQEELEIIEKFIDGEISKIEGRNTLLVRSRTKI